MLHTSRRISTNDIASGDLPPVHSCDIIRPSAKCLFEVCQRRSRLARGDWVRQICLAHINPKRQF